MKAYDYNKTNPKYKFSRARGWYFTEFSSLGVTAIICGQGLIYFLC